MTQSRRSRIRPRAWLAAWILFWLASFAATHIPIPRGVHLPSGGDKVVHVALYTCLTLLGGGALHVRKQLTATAIASWSLVYLAYGLLDEWLQSFVGRTASIHDWLADATGVVLASGLLFLLSARSRANVTPP